MLEQNITEDKAGNEYWSEVWQKQDLPKVWDVDSNSIKNYVKHRFYLEFKEIFEKHLPQNKKIALIEVGCARSQILPIFSTKFGFEIAGLDYSEIGCKQAEAILDREAVKGEIYCCDVFDIPKELIGKFDVVLSIGLIEHFSDTTAIVKALSNLLKPNGIIFTNVPNMTSYMGFLQKLFDKKIYDIHIPLNPEQIAKAHKEAGLEIINCNYFLYTNFLVLNINSTKKYSFKWFLKKFFLSKLILDSLFFWGVEKYLKIVLPPNKYFSPYINCIAKKKS